MSSSEAAIAAAVRRATIALARADGRPPGEFRLRRRLASTNSLVHFYQGRAHDGTGIVAKLIHGTRGGRLATCEAERLRDLSGHFHGEDGLHVPRVLECDPAHGIVVTEEVSGVRMDVMLRRTVRVDGRIAGTAALNRAVCLCARAGRWLARLHEIELDPATDVRPLLTRRLDAALERIRHIGMGTEERDRIRTYFHREFDGLAAVRPVLHHPDYSPYNMIATDDELYVLDLSEVAAGHPAEDAAFWWAHFERLRLLPWIDRRRVARLQGAFLDALGDGPLGTVWTRWGMMQRFSYMTDAADGGMRGLVRSAWQRLWRRRMGQWIRAQEWRT